jgi:hypothetical protein
MSTGQSLGHPLLWFLLGALAVAGLSAAGPECPPGFRCGGATAAGSACHIDEGPYKGRPGTLVDGRCVLAVTGGSAPHQHVIESGACPLCGAQGVEFLSFRVQTGSQRSEMRRVLQCRQCSSLFGEVQP